jgi:predicted molibdopterin-dependent oxidoreductase YjgC
MYDLGTLVQQSPCIAPLASETELRIHPHDFDRVGIEPGGSVRLTSSKISGVLAVCRPDDAVHRGSAHLFFNQPGIRANELIDSLEPVTDIRIESA